MPRTARVNYHVHKPDRQAFHIDAGGVVGALIAPELAPTAIQIADVRRGGAAASFAEDGLTFLEAPTEVGAFTQDGAWRSLYDAELTALLRGGLGAAEVVIFDHTVRIDDPNSDRKPARNVHSDYSASGARQRAIDILGAPRATEWSESGYAFVNVWRPVGDPINSAPLGFVRPASVDEDDWILLDLIYPDRVGQIMGLAANPRHQWIYKSKMTRDDVVVFNIYDSGGRPSIAHSAVDLIEDEAVETVRKSIESRTLVRFASGASSVSGSDGAA